MNEKIIIWGEKNSLKYVLLIPCVLCSIIFLYMVVNIGLPFNDDIGFWLVPLVFAILFGICYYSVSNSEIVVTDRRIYGITVFNKRVDLPLDSVTAIGTGFLNGIDVSTSSGRLRFKCLKNYSEVHAVISNLLMERQQSEKANVSQHAAKTDTVSELKKYKDLLDSGVITQEEFNEKKKRLLDL